jgi:tryptophan 2,3-dioxygenase
MTELTYAQYLHLDELLALQRPLTPEDEQDVRDSERLFIVVHQASETLLSQALIDLRHVMADQCAEECHAHRLERAILIVDTLTEQVRLLHNALRPQDFLRFRDRFGTASGLQSTQFHELFRLAERLTTADTAGIDTAGIAALRTAVRRWRYTHLKLVRHMIGDAPGSAETSGIRYLARRLTRVS